MSTFTSTVFFLAFETPLQHNLILKSSYDHPLIVKRLLDLKTDRGRNLVFKTIVFYGISAAECFWFTRNAGSNQFVNITKLNVYGNQKFM